MKSNSPVETLRVVGTDDGHDTVKLCFGYEQGKGYLYGYHKSRAVAGLEQSMSVGMRSADAFETEGKRFTIANGQSLLRALDTRMDGFPVSDLNRVLVNHALSASGLGNTPVFLVTGLPVDLYYKNGAPNTELINAKMNSLAKPVTRVGNGPALAGITKQHVCSEAVSAFYDALIAHDGTVDADIDALIQRRPVAVVDLGGKTMDIAVVAENVSTIYSQRSGTANVGVLHLMDRLAERIKSEFQLNQNPPIPFVEEACRTKKYELFGELKDVSAIVEEACREYLEQVANFFVSKAGDGSDLGAVLFVGGGSALLQSGLGAEAFAHVYKGRRLIAQDPEYANARGMWKFGMFVLSEQDRAIQSAAAPKAGRGSTVTLT